MTTNVERTPARWSWWGVAAGVLGLVSNVAADAQGTLPEGARPYGPEVIQLLDPATYHLGVVAGLGAFVCLLLLAAGWRRWSASGARRSLAVETIASALLASAAALLLAYGLRGGLAEYLPGAINADNFSAEGLLVLFVMDDTAPWLGWWGVIVAAGLCAWASFEERLVPVWLGVVSVLAVLLPVVLMALSGAVAIAGLIGPLWLAVASLVVALRGL